MISLQRYNDFDAMNHQIWNRLVTDSATHSIFQTYQWSRAWWETFQSNDRELLLLVASEADVVVGIAAMFVDQRQTLKFVGHGRADYSDIVCSADRDDIRIALIREMLSARVGCRRIQFRQLPEQSPTVRCIRQSHQRTLLSETGPCPTLLIDGNDEHFDRVRSKKSLRRHHNHFQKQSGYQVQHFTQSEDILPHLEAFFGQHIARWSATRFPSLFQEDINRQFYRRLTKSLGDTGWLRFTRITVDDRPIAFHFGFVFERTFFWYKPSFDPMLAKKSPGEALLSELFTLAKEENMREFDFTIGAEAFKQRFANHTRRNLEATLYASPFDFQLQTAVRTTKDYLRSSPIGGPVFRLAKRITDRS
jgi:CelD/BcsL family acetyltransferase involved in cellulose biosynthesis